MSKVSSHAVSGKSQSGKGVFSCKAISYAQGTLIKHKAINQAQSRAQLANISTHKYANNNVTKTNCEITSPCNYHSICESGVTMFSTGKISAASSLSYKNQTYKNELKSRRKKKQKKTKK